MDTHFLGRDQRSVTIADRERLAPFLAAHPHALSGYTFAALFGWQAVFDYAWSLEDDLLLVSFARKGERHLLQPIGTLRPEVAEDLLREARALPYALEVVGVDERFLATDRAFVERFGVAAAPEGSNYVYRARDLAELKGARFAKKRNLIAQASSYAWTAEPLRAEHAAECREVLHEAGALRDELALERTLDHLGELGQRGVLVRVAGRVEAFSIFEEQAPGVAVVHFERALRSRKGLYQVVNRETARAIVDLGYTWLNREEDLGDAGLRQAKRSYHPELLAPAYRLQLAVPGVLAVPDERHAAPAA